MVEEKRTQQATRLTRNLAKPHGFACSSARIFLPDACAVQPGEVAEWSMASVLKTEVGKPTVGSNPTLSAIV